MLKTLRFRLTLWHAIIFGGMALGVFCFAYITVSRQLLGSLTEDLQDTSREFSDIYQTGGIKALRAEINQETLSHGNNLFYARFINARGKVIIRSIPKAWVEPLPRPDISAVGPQWFEVTVNHRTNELARLIAIPTRGHGWIQVGLSERDYEAQLEKIRRSFGWALMVIILAGIITGWWQVSRALAGVDRVRRTAIDIGEGAFDQRLVLEGHGQELVQLADAFNLMLDKIQSLLGEMRDVSDNVAHDLRTPITRIRGMAEASLMAKADDYPGSRETLAKVIAECDIMSAMINTMLEIAQTDSGVMRLEHKPVDMGVLLHEVRDLFLPAVEDAGIDLNLELQAAHLSLMGDKSRLQRLVSNLLDNAIKFSPGGGRITLSICGGEGAIRLFVTDCGMGIPEGDMPYVFDRFYRSDRSRGALGNGLGLSYAKSIAMAHGGDIHIQSRFGHGTSVCVTLPATPTDPLG